MFLAPIAVLTLMKSVDIDSLVWQRTGERFGSIQYCKLVSKLEGFFSFESYDVLASISHSSQDYKQLCFVLYIVVYKQTHQDL